jgi:hypothetical protein
MAKVGVDPVEYGTTGLYECTWTTRITVVRSGYGNRTGSITTSGIFPADPTKSATFAIIGGTGDFEGAKGTMITEENPDCKYSKDPKSCVLKETFYFQ